MPYVEVSVAITWFVTDESAPGMLPATGSSSSPLKTSVYLRSRSSLSECGALSAIAKTGSPSFSPIETSTRFPSVVSTRPTSARGRLAHWYFLIPP
jgi:hypothetical protein